MKLKVTLEGYELRPKNSWIEYGKLNTAGQVLELTFNAVVDDGGFEYDSTKNYYIIQED